MESSWNDKKKKLFLLLPIAPQLHLTLKTLWKEKKKGKRNPTVPWDALAVNMKVSNTGNLERAQLWMTEALLLVEASDRPEILNTWFLSPLTKVMEF